MDSLGAQANGGSGDPSISGSGRFVAFYSEANNLVPGDMNSTDDIFVHDRQAGATKLASIDTSGYQGNGVSYDPDISQDGYHVGFYSYATNLVLGDTNGEYDIFVHDCQSGVTRRVEHNSYGNQSNAWSFRPSMSGDGRYVAFDSAANNLVPGVTFGGAFVSDRDCDGLVNYCSPAGVSASGCSAMISSSGAASATASSGFFLVAAHVEGAKDGLFFYGTNGRQANPWGNGTSYQCVVPPVKRGNLLNGVGTVNGCDGSFSQDHRTLSGAQHVRSPFTAQARACWFRLKSGTATPVRRATRRRACRTRSSFSWDRDSGPALPQRVEFVLVDAQEVLRFGGRELPSAASAVRPSRSHRAGIKAERLRASCVPRCR